MSSLLRWADSAAAAAAVDGGGGGGGAVATGNENTKKLSGGHIRADILIRNN